jgi:hypothetical protein
MMPAQLKTMSSRSMPASAASTLSAEVTSACLARRPARRACRRPAQADGRDLRAERGQVVGDDGADALRGARRRARACR